MSGKLFQAGKGFPDAREGVVLILNDEAVLIIQPKGSLQKTNILAFFQD